MPNVIDLKYRTDLDFITDLQVAKAVIADLVYVERTPVDLGSIFRCISSYEINPDGSSELVVHGWRPNRIVPAGMSSTMARALFELEVDGLIERYDVTEDAPATTRKPYIVIVAYRRGPNMPGTLYGNQTYLQRITSALVASQMAREALEDRTQP